MAVTAAELVVRARSGDLAAFEQLMVRFEKPVLATALRLTGRFDQAQDATQEAFLRLHRNLASLVPGQDPGPWLYRVLENVCRDMARNRRSSRLFPMDVKAERTPSAGPDPERALSLRERERLLNAGLQKLSEHERAAIVLRELHGYSTGDVAGMLGSSEATVRSQICTARLKLRKFLKGLL